MLLMSLLFMACTTNDDIVADNQTVNEIEDETTTDEPTVEEPTEETVVLLNLNEVINANDELSLLSEAIIKAGLEETFSEDGPNTVFAPSNEAIEELFDLLGDEFNSFEDFNGFLEVELLRRILTFHVTQANLLSRDFVAGELTTLYDNTTIEIIASDDVFAIRDASPINANFLAVDHLATNGTLHIIDKILVPEEVAEVLDLPSATDSKPIKELIEETDEFTFLEEALVLTDLLETLGEQGPFTVFAPSDDSLTTLLAFLGEEFTSIEDFDSEEEIAWLREVLLYHVVPGLLTSSDFTEGPLITLSGENTLALLDRGDQFSIIDGTSFQANIIVKNITAQNGMIHIVDRILVPESILNALAGTVSSAFEQVMISDENLKTSLELFRLVQNSMDLEALSNKEFTFFLPTDQAFEDLFNALGYDTLESFNSEAGQEVLKDILSYHCVENRKVTTTDFTTGEILSTYQGEKIKVQTDVNGVYLLDKTESASKVIIADEEILQGVIHVVDKVLLPQEVLKHLSAL